MKKIIYKIIYRIKTTCKTWAIGQIKDKQFLYRLSNGYRIFLNIDKQVDKEVYIGSFEAININFFRKLLEGNMVIFDVGANIGYYSIVAAGKLKNNGVIYAFEPASTPFNQFQLNIQINAIQNIELFQLGVADKSGEVNFNVCEDDAYNSIGSSPMSTIKQSLKINVVSIDEFCENKNIKHIDIMKIDTEGAEYLILKGGKNIFSSSNAPILFCEYNKSTITGFDYNLQDFDGIIKSYGYTPYELSYGNLRKFDAEVSNGYNIVCLKENHLEKIRHKISIY